MNKTNKLRLDTSPNNRATLANWYAFLPPIRAIRDHLSRSERLLWAPILWGLGSQIRG